MAATYHVLALPLQFKKIGCIPRKFPHRVCPDFSARLSLLFRVCASLFERTRNMAQVYFHYSNTAGVKMERGGAAVGNLAEACDQATLVVRSLIMAPSEEDWRSWVLHVSDEHGDEIFDVPFTSMLGKPH
jgi:hypothetical protein